MTGNNSFPLPRFLFFSAFVTSTPVHIPLYVGGLPGLKVCDFRISKCSLLSKMAVASDIQEHAFHRFSASDNCYNTVIFASLAISLLLV